MCNFQPEFGFAKLDDTLFYRRPCRNVLSFQTSHTARTGQNTVFVRFLFLPQKEVYENLHTAMLGATGLKNCTSLYSFSTRVCFANSQDLRLFRIRAGDIRRKRLASGASPRRRFPRRVWLLLPSVADYPALSNVRRKTVCSQCGKERGFENRTSVYDFQHEF